MTQCTFFCKRLPLFRPSEMLPCDPVLIEDTGFRSAFHSINVLHDSPENGRVGSFQTRIATKVLLLGTF